MSDRENYRETPVAGSELVLKSWSEGTKIMTVLSWPPHGIERPIGIRLTLSQDEFDLLSGAFIDGGSPETDRLLIHIGQAVLVQCGLIRKMMELDPNLTLTPEEKP